MECCGRPNRSDAHLSREEEAEIESKTREYFDGVTPKHHSKPQRSEYSSKYVDDLKNKDEIPELVEFHRLESDSQKIVLNGSEVGEEFVETDYYKDLNETDKQHHTTGTGFIKMPNKSDNRYNLAPDSDTDVHASCQCNPATNDWIPDDSAANTVAFDSGKPRRSDN
ncbi:hypothetical protein ACFX13_006193 [Malus domestica]|uniref:Maternal effect embryo arrest 59 n=1 Tax=Malus domestica TaxID=3750 RepID=A0A498ITR8_MALDO|nr:uncharacterized protein LOC103447667 [Malus domestica]XP_050110328.1 uncharacterized protein LOC126589142 [Malus sylvestris]RXH84733.1 hypothetical protein DVH24_033017 [Malus domestica]